MESSQSTLLLLSYLWLPLFRVPFVSVLCFASNQLWGRCLLLCCCPLLLLLRVHPHLDHRRPPRPCRRSRSPVERPPSKRWQILGRLVERIATCRVVVINPSMGVVRWRVIPIMAVHCPTKTRTTTKTTIDRQRNSSLYVKWSKVHGINWLSLVAVDDCNNSNNNTNFIREEHRVLVATTVRHHHPSNASPSFQVY